jgi:hypothetical protein
MMYVATMSIYNSRDKETKDIILGGPNLPKLHEKIARVRKMLEDNGFTFLSSVIDEIHGIDACDDDFLIDSMISDGKRIH